MKKLILFLGIFILFSHGYAEKIERFMVSTFFSPKGKPIEIKLHKQIGDTIYLLGTHGEFISVSLSSAGQHYAKWYEEMLDPDDVTDFTVIRGGRDVYLATEKGLYFYQPGQYQPKVSNNKLPKAKMAHVYARGDELFLLYTNRLILVKGNVWWDINIPNGNVLDDFKKFIVDANGVNWLLGEKGIIRLNDKKASIYSKRRPFKSYPVDVIRAKTGDLFLKTDDNLLRWFNSDNKWYNLTHTSIPDGNIFIDPLSHLFLFDEDNLYSFEGGQFKPVQLPDFIKDEGILGIYHNNFDRIYIVTSRSLVTVFTSSLIVDKVLNKYLPLYVANLRTGQDPFSGLLGKIFQNVRFFSDPQKNTYFRELADRGMEGERLSVRLEQILSNLPQNNRKKLQKEIELALLQEAPDLAVYLQNKILKNITMPDEIINGYYDLAQIYSATGQKEFEQAVYRKVRNMFSGGSASYGWMMLHLAEAAPDQKENEYWQYLKEHTRDPILRTLVKDHYYETYTEKQIFAKANASTDIIQAAAPFRIKKIAADENGAWLLGQNSKLRYLDRQTGQINGPRIRKSASDIIASDVGTIVLLRNGYLNLVTADGLQKLQPYPPLNGAVQNIWSAMGMPVIKLKKYVYYFTNDKWNKFRLPSEITNYRFLKVLPADGNTWLLFTPTKIYSLDIGSGAIQGLQIPVSVITIFDARKNTSGGFYIATNDGLYHLLDEQWQKLDQRDGFWGSSVKSLAYVKKRNILLANSDSTVYLHLKNQWHTLHGTNYPAEQIALALDGTAYWSLDKTVYIWKRSAADETDMALNANRTAAYLYHNKMYDDLVKFLSKLTSSKSMSQWAYEFLGRTYLQQKKYSSAYEQYYMGAKLNRNNPWITDSEFAALGWQLFEKGSWDNALKCGRFVVKNYAQSKIKTYLFKFFYKKTTSGVLSQHLTERLEILKWLKQTSGKILPAEELDRYLNVMLILQYKIGLKKKKPNIMNLAKAVQTFPNSPYKNLWQYYIIKTLVQSGQFDRAIKISAAATEKMDRKSPMLPFIGRLRAEAYRKNTVR